MLDAVWLPESGVKLVLQPLPELGHLYQHVVLPRPHLHNSL